MSALKPKQAAAALGISLSLLYALCAANAIRHTRHGRPGKRGCIRIDEAALEEYRKACEKGEPASVPAPKPPPPVKPKLKLSHLTLKPS